MSFETAHPLTHRKLRYSFDCVENSLVALQDARAQGDVTGCGDNMSVEFLGFAIGRTVA